MIKNGERGNILLIIFVAVALFAMLGYALTQGARGLSSSTTREQDRLNASEIIQYGNDIRPAIDKLLLLGGAADINTSGNGILFSATGANAAYGTPGTQPATELFNASGGKITYATPPQAACASACAYEFSGQYTVTGVGDDANPELVMLVPDIKQGTCEQLNSVLGLGWSSIPTGGALTLTRFDGTAYGGGNAVTLTGAANIFVGKRAFCYKEATGAGRYIFLEVIRAR
jgi:hypothetical protein